MGIFDKLRKGLEKTREKVSTGFRAVLRVGTQIDDSVIGHDSKRLSSFDLEAREFHESTPSSGDGCLPNRNLLSPLLFEAPGEGFAQRLRSSWPPTSSRPSASAI